MTALALNGLWLIMIEGWMGVLEPLSLVVLQEIVCVNEIDGVVHSFLTGSRASLL